MVLNSGAGLGQDDVAPSLTHSHVKEEEIENEKEKNLAIKTTALKQYSN